jgi:hypothetical protein
VVVEDDSVRRSAALSRRDGVSVGVHAGGGALRTMATYIDLNPVRAGITDDPGKYRWSGYAEAMAGVEEAVEGIVKLTGMSAENVYGREVGRVGSDAALPHRAAAPRRETGAQRKRRQLRALVVYRQLLGIVGRPRVREDGVEVRRGVSAKVQARLEAESGVRREQLMKQVRHFTAGVIFGSRAFIDEWFERNRDWFRGRSREHRKTGARKIGRDWKQLYTLRQLRR